MYRLGLGAGSIQLSVLVLPSHQENPEDGEGSVHGTPENHHILTWLSAREHFIDLCRRENFKSYITFGILLFSSLAARRWQFNCAFLDSRQLVLLSTLIKFLHSFCGQKVGTRRSEKFNPNWCQSFFILLSDGPDFTGTKQWGEALHYIRLFFKISGAKLV